MPVSFSSNLLSKKQSGLSLLELLVVVSILAAIAGIGVQVYGDTDQQVQVKLSSVELQVVANAVRRFKQDTGYYPKSGPFDLKQLPRIGEVSLDTLPDYVLGPVAKKIAWFDSPANLSQLITAPVDMNNNPIMPWNVETGKGWRGPYLSSTKLCYMDLSDDLSRAGFGDYENDFGGLLKNIPVLPDVISNNPAVPVSIGYDPDGYLVDCRKVPTTNTTYDASLHELGRPGSPYLLFLYDIDEGGTNHPKPKVVMVGANGVFDGTEGGYFDSEDRWRYAREDWCTGLEDDVVICL
ncbi:MAG: prepilin-type N-terminal cleavage/methylation domain-containing protein [Alteromonadales bacterium]|nr:prepilin-type N-terminal cleavage/methylation domain-containing protein [Alteromonadales bacterium]